MTITIRQKALANDNISLYLDIYDGGKRKFEFLSLYLLPEVDAETKARNEETLQRAHQIRAERILHPETIPEVGHLMIVKEIPNDESPEVLDWIQTYIDWMSDNTDYSKAIVDQSKYLKYLMSEFLANKRRPHITLRKFDKEWFKAFFLWLKNDYVPQKYVRVEAKPLCEGSLHNVQQRIVAVFNKAVKFGKLKANPFYQLEKSDIFSKPKSSHKQYLTPDELKRFMASDERSPGVAETQRAFGFACLTGLRISDIKALRWSDIKRNKVTNTLVIVQKKTKALNAVPIGNTALSWMPPKGDDDFVFHLPAKANVDAALKRIAKKVGIEKNISFHCSRHTFGILVQAVTGNIETTKKLMGHKSLKSTSIYADVLTHEKVKAVDNMKKAFRGRKQREENKQASSEEKTDIREEKDATVQRDNNATVEKKEETKGKQKEETKDSPIMKQWKELKAKHPDALLLFRVGDFYEMYEQDAKRGAEVLGITLTKRNTQAGPYMAGFPHHALDTYLPKLIRAGERVAICDQLEAPKQKQEEQNTEEQQRSGGMKR